MNLIIKDIYGTIEHLTEVCMNAEVTVKTSCNGEIQAESTFYVAPNSTKTTKITLVKYLGGLNINNGFNKTTDKPFQMTPGGKKCGTHS